MISLPQGSTVKINNLTNNTTIDLTDILGQVSPLLMSPAILDLIRNTSVKPAASITGNSVYAGTVKPISEQTITKNGNSAGNVLAKDPRAKTSREIEAMVSRHAAEQFADKLHGLGYDLNTPSGRAELALQVAGWIGLRRMEKSIKLIDEAIKAADVVQADIVAGFTDKHGVRGVIAAQAGATTFAKGAHVETKAVSTSDDAYTLFAAATANFRRLGLATSKNLADKQYSRSIGMTKKDVFVIMTPEFEALILAKAGVFASTEGNALYKKASIKEILGIPTTTALELPEDVNFMVITTGINGALGHQLIGDGIASNIVVDPDWTFGQRVDMVDNFTLGVVYDYQIFVQKQA